MEGFMYTQLHISAYAWDRRRLWPSPLVPSVTNGTSAVHALLIYHLRLLIQIVQWPSRTPPPQSGGLAS